MIISAVTVAATQKYGEIITISTGWKTVASDTNGINNNIRITSSVYTGVSRIDVRMLGKNGNVIWEEQNSCPALSARVYSCGADVYTVQVKASSSSARGTVYALPTDDPAD